MNIDNIEARVEALARLKGPEHRELMPADLIPWLIVSYELANELLTEVKRLRYLEKYEPAFQVYAVKEYHRGEPDWGEDDAYEYTSHDSVKECEEYIATLEDGWRGHIEVIEWYEPAQNPQLKTLSEWQESEEE